jgi:hypothetical protein
MEASRIDFICVCLGRIHCMDGYDAIAFYTIAARYRHAANCKECWSAFETALIFPACAVRESPDRENECDAADQ